MLNKIGALVGLLIGVVFVILVFSVLALFAVIIFGFVSLCMPSAPLWLLYVATVIVFLSVGVRVSR